MNENKKTVTSSSESTKTSLYVANTSGKLDTSDFFSNRDLIQTADTNNSVTIIANNKT